MRLKINLVGSTDIISVVFEVTLPERVVAVQFGPIAFRWAVTTPVPGVSFRPQSYGEKTTENAHFKPLMDLE